MQSFIEEVVADILTKPYSIEDVIFVLPSKRAGTFLRRAISQKVERTLFAPKIYSIEGFIEKISLLSYASNTQLLFELYSTYRISAEGEKDNFMAFSKWGQILLQDFNEIDRYLVDSKAIFSNLSAIQEISIWAPGIPKTKMMENYLRFWNGIETIYTHFSQNLLGQGLGYQGLVYRQACENLESYLTENAHPHIFVGFNALNIAESRIIQRILNVQHSDIYWDIDNYFLNDPIHDAGYFIRQYKSTWGHLKRNPIKGPNDFYTSPKNIRVIGVPKNVAQAKYVGNLLSNINKKNSKTLENTALILGEEALLNPVINSISHEIEPINITMGYPLQKTALAEMFQLFFDLHITKAEKGWYHQNVTRFLAHPYVRTLLKTENENLAEKIVTYIKTRNIAFVTPKKIQSLAQPDDTTISLLFFDAVVSPAHFLQRCLQIIEHLRIASQQEADSLVLEYLYRFLTLFNEIIELLQKHDFIDDLKSLLSLFKELLSSENLDFQGDALSGLQIMGMLESRNLDFETVILTSVNEGILPSGKSNNSFIPFDLKASFGLPTYKEKDAVYTYHFYRLIQRAKNIYILYNTEPDVLEGGEKSRLITQLLTDESKTNDITEFLAAPKVNPPIRSMEVITKDDHLMELIKSHASNGFSPSSLSNYIRNPLDFYKQGLLGIDDAPKIEESVAANTFGTIIHNTLEDLYSPLLGKYLSAEVLQNLKPTIKPLVHHHFSVSHKEGDISQGKNLIALNVIIRYIENFVDLEIKAVEKSQIRLLGLEQKLNVQLEVPEVDFPINLKGKLDRIDEKDGQIRIIDYKTGKVDSKNVSIFEWNDVIVNYDSSKAFQLLCYAFMYHKQHSIDPLEAGIISFKNLNSGLLKFARQEKKGSTKKDSRITEEVLRSFELQLKSLIQEICNIGTPLIEKEI